MSKKDRNTTYNKFKTAMNTPVDHKKPPKAICDAWAAAISCTSRKATTHMFEHFVMTAGDYTEMLATITGTRVHEESSEEKDRWFTQSQLAGHYNLPIEHPSILNIIGKKKALGLYRLHSEAPEDAFLTLFDCMAEMSKTKKDIMRVSASLSATVVPDSVD